MFPVMGDAVAPYGMKKRTSASQTAERSQRYRDRRRNGVRVVQIEIDERDIFALANAGFITNDPSLNNEDIAFALEWIVELLAVGGIEIDKDQAVAVFEDIAG